MNRQIEFRAWNHTEKRYLTDKELGSLTLWFLSQPNNLTLQQFTGLYDRNNQKIFEGDVVSNGSWKGTVEYSTIQGGGWKPFACDGKGDHECNFNWGNYWEVVGNIYETPSLLPNLDQNKDE